VFLGDLKMINGQYVLAAIQLHHNAYDCSFLEFGPDKLLNIQIGQLLKSKYIDEVIINVPDDEINRKFECFVSDKVHVFYGSFEPDQRLDEAVNHFNGDIVVNIYGNQPFNQADIIDTALDHMIKEKKVYYSTFSFCLPAGLSFKIFKRGYIKEYYCDKNDYQHPWLLKHWKRHLGLAELWTTRVYSEETVHIFRDFYNMFGSETTLDNLFEFYNKFNVFESHSEVCNHQKRILFYPAFEESYTFDLLNFFLRKNYIVDFVVNDLPLFYKIKKHPNLNAVFFGGSDEGDIRQYDFDIDYALKLDRAYGQQYSQEEMNNYISYVVKYFEQFSPEFIFIKNGFNFRRNILVQAAKLFNKQVIYTEEGYVRTPSMYSKLVDKQGINFEGSLTHKRDYRELSNEENERLSEFLEEFHREMDQTDCLPEKYGKFIFLALQVEIDTQIVYYSPLYQKMIEVVNDVFKNKPSDVNLVVKPHPLWQKEEMLKAINQLANDRNDIFLDVESSTHSLIKQSIGTVVINSTVGFEALTYYKPVVVLGQAFYGHKGFTIDVNHGNDLKTALQAIEGFQPDISRLNSFLYDVIFNYLYIYKSADKAMNTFQAEQFGEKILELINN